MMLIALPNTNKTFTCTLFMKTTGKNSVTQLKDKKSVFTFFENNFIDVIDLIPDLYKYIENTCKHICF